MTLTNKQQFVICAMVNADPTHIPEKATAEEKKYREELVAEADRFEKRYGKRPSFEIPIDPWDDGNIDEEDESEELKQTAAAYENIYNATESGLIKIVTLFPEQKASGIVKAKHKKEKKFKLF